MNADGSKCVARWSISYRVVLLLFWSSSQRRFVSLLLLWRCSAISRRGPCAAPFGSPYISSLLVIAVKFDFLAVGRLRVPHLFLYSKYPNGKRGKRSLSSAVVADALCLISKNKKTARAVRYSISISQGNMNEPGHGRPVSLSALYAAGPLPGTAGRGLHHFFGCCAQMLRGRKRYRECPMRCWCALDLALS